MQNTGVGTAKRGKGVGDIEFPGVVEERARGNSRSSQLIGVILVSLLLTLNIFHTLLKRSGISRGVLRKTHMKFEWVFVF